MFLFLIGKHLDQPFGIEVVNRNAKLRFKVFVSHAVEKDRLIGFDCGHAWDITARDQDESPYNLYLKMEAVGATFKDKEFVIQELKDLLRQPLCLCG